MSIKKMLLGTAVAAGLVGGLAAGVGPAYADDWSGADRTQAAAKKSWDCHGTDWAKDDFSADCWYGDGPGSHKVGATFQEYGEILYIYDNYNNDHSTLVKVKIEGVGTAYFTSKGKGERRLNLSYDENKDITMTVCTSSSSKAKCAKNSGHT